MDREKLKEEEPTRVRNKFGPLAEAYKAFRRDYPEQVYQGLFAFYPNPNSDVLDLGCGTGIVTKHLAEYYRKVTGIDPTQEMLNMAKPSLPEKVELIKGTAESLPFPDSSLNLVVSAQAFHWFDYDKAGAEIMRVLKSDGKFYTFWNNGGGDSQFNLPLFVYQNILKYIPKIPRSGKEEINEALFKRIGFKRVEKVQFKFDEKFTEEQLLGYLRSHSAFNLLTKEDKEKYIEDSRRDLQPKLVNGLYTFPKVMLIYECEK